MYAWPDLDHVVQRGRRACILVDVCRRVCTYIYIYTCIHIYMKYINIRMGVNIECDERKRSLIVNR